MLPQHLGSWSFHAAKATASASVMSSSEIELQQGERAWLRLSLCYVAGKRMPEMMMTALMQADLIKEIAALVDDYRKGDKSLVKFGMKCGIALNRFPTAGGIMHNPKHTEEKFKIGDAAFRENFATDKEAFFAAFDAFVANTQFVAWDGRVPDPKFVMLEELSENFAWHTMMLEMVYRKRGSEQEKKLNMFFIGFPDEASASAYARKHAGLLVATKPFRGKFHDWT